MYILKLLDMDPCDPSRAKLECVFADRPVMISLEGRTYSTTWWGLSRCGIAVPVAGRFDLGSPSVPSPRYQHGLACSLLTGSGHAAIWGLEFVGCSA